MNKENETLDVRPVIGYEGLYEVTSEGEVYSLNYSRSGERVKLVGVLNSGGYPVVSLCKNRKARLYRVHRLVAEAFIPNPDNKPHIDHINTVRTDNRVENLRWCTNKENNNNPITRVALREAHQKLAQDPEWRRRVKEANQKKTQDPEWRRRVKEAAQKLAQDPKWRRKVNEANRKKAQDPEWRRKVNESCAKAVYCVELDRVFDSARDAARQLGLSFGNISSCCRGKRETVGGYHFNFHIQE